MDQIDDTSLPRSQCGGSDLGMGVLDNITVGYCFGPKKLETMTSIMEEASRALSTFECEPSLAPLIHRCKQSRRKDADESSVKTATAVSAITATASHANFSDDEGDDTVSLNSAFTRASEGPDGAATKLEGIRGIQLLFLPDSNGFVHLVNSSSSSSVGVEGESPEYCNKVSSSVSCSSRSLKTDASASSTNLDRRIRVNFLPVDLDIPLEEQHGGKFDVILHKLTEDILGMSKIISSRRADAGADSLQMTSHANVFDSTPSMTRHQARASRRIKRLEEYKESIQPECVLVDNPRNILSVMSRAEMAEILTRSLQGAGVTTKSNIPVRTPNYYVVHDDVDLECECSVSSLGNKIDRAGFGYPLIAKPLTAAGTKSSHHMGIVLNRDGLRRLKTPCLLQEYTNHGEILNKVYVLGDSVWSFSRPSLPNLPAGEFASDGKMSSGRDERQFAKSYVEFERPKGSRCYVEFNSQKPYPSLEDFGVGPADPEIDLPSKKRQRVNDVAGDSSEPPEELSDLTRRYVTTDEMQPVTNALREAFGLELFGYDVLVRKDNGGDVEILVVDVNYFPGYKEVRNFPSLLAQFLTQKAVKSRLLSCSYENNKVA